MAFLADDDVVVDGNAERLGDLDNGLRHLNVGTRRSRIARQMVVHESDGGRGEFERALNHLAQIDRRVVDGADLLQFIRDQLIALVEEEHAELFLLGEGHSFEVCRFHADVLRWRLFDAIAFNAQRQLPHIIR